MRDYPHLIQRMIRADDPSRPGVDGKFQLEYMGSSEFEWGALPDSLRVMRATIDSSWKPEKLIAGAYVAWYAGPLKFLGLATAMFADEVLFEYPAKYRLKESTYLYKAYRGEKWVRCDSWWSVNEGFGFAFFMRKEDAETWLQLLREPAPEKSK